MPTRQYLLLLTFLLAGCDRQSLQQQVAIVRQFSAREDRLYTEQALQQIGKTYWTPRDHAWLGKLPDGRIVRLENPRDIAAPLPSRAFYSGWHLQLTITSEQWRTYPPSRNAQPFQAVYAITRHGAENWDIDVTGGTATTPLQREDLAFIHD
jgi:hypothetical protein